MVLTQTFVGRSATQGGREEFDYDSQRGSRKLLHGKRHHIKVEGDGVAPEDLEPWHSYVKTDVLPMP